MLPWLQAGNPSSLHYEGRRAKDAIDAAREAISGALGSLFAEVIFTSGGSEAANLALVGVALANKDPRRTRILLGAAEHHCVLHAESLLTRLAYSVETVPVDRTALVDEEALERLMDDRVLLVSAMHANNELGTMNDVSRLAQLVHAHGALLHTDAVQTFGKLSWTVDELQADLVNISAHKIGGPKGVGALYVRAGTPIKPLVVGGGQERELRGGTENVAAIAGFAAALAEPYVWAHPNPRDRFLDLLGEIGAVPTVPNRDETLPGHAHVRFPGRDAETLLIRLDRLGVSASSGAACSSGSLEPSHVLLACGYSQAEAKEGLRFTFGRENTLEEAEIAARRVGEALGRVQDSARK